MLHYVCSGCGLAGTRHDIGMHYRTVDLSTDRVFGLPCLYSAFKHKNRHGIKPPVDYLPLVKKEKKRKRALLKEKEKKNNIGSLFMPGLLVPDLEYTSQLVEKMRYYASHPPIDPHLFDKVVANL